MTRYQYCDLLFALRTFTLWFNPFDASARLITSTILTLTNIRNIRTIRTFAVSSCPSYIPSIQLVINCCGPFRTFGEPVVSACIAAGTHHLDVSGEPQYIERMQLLHDEAARRAGSLVIVACGFDSIPADLGVVYTEQQFGGTVNAIESYLRAWQRGGIRLGSGAVANYGTWESIVHGIAHWNELAALRAAQRKADATAGDVAHAVALPAALLLRKRGVLHRAPVLNGRWALPFPGADRAIVLRSQRILHRWDGHKRPVQMRTYVAFDSWLHALAIALFAVLFAVMARFAWGREQLLQHPRFFSGGAFSHQGPTEETQARTRFSVTFRAEGWQDKRDGGESAGGAVDKRMVTRVTGTNPGYGATCVAVVLAAKVVLTEAEKVRGR